MCGHFSIPVFVLYWSLCGFLGRGGRGGTSDGGRRVDSRVGIEQLEGRLPPPTPFSPLHPQPQLFMSPLSTSLVFNIKYTWVYMYQEPPGAPPHPHSSFSRTEEIKKGKTNTKLAKRSNLSLPFFWLLTRIGDTMAFWEKKKVSPWSISWLIFEVDIKGRVVPAIYWAGLISHATCLKWWYAICPKKAL